MSVAVELNDSEQQNIAPTPSNIKLDITNNWTGVDELPFEPIAERMLEMEAEEAGQAHKGALSVTFGKPTFLDGKGWACVFKMSAMGREHVSPARGVDAVDALQAAFSMAHRQLSGMARMHKITLFGGDYLAYGSLAGEPAAAKPASGGCPVMNGSMDL